MKPAQKILEQEAALPSAETKLNILKLVIEKLTQNDRYTYIGMDHFARPTDELAVAQRRQTLQRNFQGYSTKGGADIYAFGMSAISQADGVYWQNIKDLPGYYAALDSGWEPFAKGYVLSSRRQNSPPHHHAADVRSEPGLRRALKDLGIDFANLFCRGTGFHGGPGKGRPVASRCQRPGRSTTWAGFSSATSPCALIAIFRQPRNAAFPKQYETCCHHRRRHYRADRRLYSQATRRARQLSSGPSRGRRDPIRAPRRLSGRIRPQQHSGDIPGRFQPGARLGLESRRLYSNPAAEKRYVVRGRNPWPCPIPPEAF
jgi:hypothetical protein